MTFDPMTGEPIQDSDNEEMAFDPMTGEPVNRPAGPEPAPTSIPVQEPVSGFDPMTGQPLNQGPTPALTSIPVQEPVSGFDPMTGQPLNQGPTPAPTSIPVQEPVSGFDPMTGQPLNQGPTPAPTSIPIQEPVSGFDPMTGQPLNQPQPAQPTGGFDPMTGKPLNQPSEPQPTSVQPTGGFDPMTGKPLNQPQPAQPTGGFDPMTGRPIQDALNGKKKKERKIKMPVIIGGVAAILVVILVVAAISSGLFMGKAGKVMMAAANTFKDRPHFVEAFENTFSVLAQEKYTIALSGDLSDVKFDGELRNGGREKQLSFQMSQDGSKLEMIAGIDTKCVKLQMPQLSSYLFVYDYNKDITGYLADEVDEETIEQINTTLKSLTEQKTDIKKFYADVFKVYTDELKSISFVNADKEEFTIDDKDVDCKGYTAVLTDRNMIHVVDQIETLVGDKYASLFQTMLVADMDIYSPSADWKETVADAFDELREELEDMEDIELSFYLYKNKLAGIVLRTPEEDAEAELCFEGGDYRMQNMTLKVDDERYRLTGSDDGSKEVFKLEERSGSYKQQLASLEYNYDNGKFEVIIDDASVKGKVTSSGSEVNFKISEIGSYYYSIAPELDITVKKGAKIEKLDGKEFDLGKADEDDYMDLAEDIQDKIYDKDLDWLMYYLY